MDNASLPGRYRVLTSHNGRRYLDDGSNFVRYVDDMTDADIRAAAFTDIAEHEERASRYVAAMEAAMEDGSYAEGWRHAGCDHANGICSG